MIDCDFFYQELLRREIDFFTGVPDSILSGFCAYVTDHAPSERHIITANEGGAIALACGYHLATGRIGLVYMQNSGQGNAVNPLVSLADPEVYAIPILLLVSWRGEPGKHDAPQHIKEGRITLNLLDTLEVPYQVLPAEPKQAQKSLQEITDVLRQRNGPAALIVRKGTFSPYDIQRPEESQSGLTREQAIKIIVDNLDRSDVAVSTTGKISRELYEYRQQIGGDHSKDFMTIGSMGHCSQIALGIALAKPGRNVYCLDGDGALLMHMGSMAIIGSCKPRNFKHIVLNNGCHDSTGGQPTCGFAVAFTDIAKACGYKLALCAHTAEQVRNYIKRIKSAEGPAILEIRVDKGARGDLGRPSSTPGEDKSQFMEFLAK